MVEKDIFKQLKNDKETGRIQWTPAKTKISQLPEEELQRLCGLVPKEIDHLNIQKAETMIESFKNIKAVSQYAVPTKWRWDDVGCENWITPIRDQGSCGSCVAFGTLGALESVLKIKHYNNSYIIIDLSEAHLFFCGGRTCSQGWHMSDALNYIKANGVPPESCFPYNINGKCSDTCNDWSNLVGPTKGINWTLVSNTITQMQENLVRYGPQVAAMAVYRDFYYYAGGIYIRTSNDLRGYHCICAIGYDDEDECWICKNSWGTDWGMEGFFKIGYYECGIIGFGFYTITL
jgi:C1A family cysteine protease